MSNSNLAEKLKRREQENREILEAAGELVSSKISKSGNTAVVQCEMGTINSGAGIRGITSYIGTRTVRDLSNDALF